MTPAGSINDYALLSDCQTAALVGRSGSVDWYCPPRFDSPSVFARLLYTGGGHWSIRPAGRFEVHRSYLESTMVLRTEGGRVALTDALAFEEGARGHEIGLRSPHTLLRRIEGLEGEVDLELEFVPRLEYALTAPLLAASEPGAVAQAGPTELHLFADVPLELQETRATARFTARVGKSVGLALVYRRAGAGDGGGPSPPEVGAGIQDTSEGWASWAAMHGGYEGPYAEQVRQGALVLQALTYAPTGAIVVARRPLYRRCRAGSGTGTTASPG